MTTSPHHRRRAIHESLTYGDRASDWLTELVGSWRFIIWQNVIVFTWIVFNVVAVFGLHWDPYPFILLNLVFSWQASNTGPVLQMTGNRSAAKDRKRDDVEAEEVDQLFSINKEQLELLKQQATVVQQQTENGATLQQILALVTALQELPKTEETSNGGSNANRPASRRRSNTRN